MTSDVVTAERVGPAMVVTIERESSGNSISREVVAGLADGIRRAESNKGVAAVVITGRGGKFFAAGGDLRQYRELRRRSELATAFAGPRALMDAIEARRCACLTAVRDPARRCPAESRAYRPES